MFNLANWEVSPWETSPISMQAGWQSALHGNDSKAINKLYKQAQIALGEGNLAAYQGAASQLQEMGISPPAKGNALLRWHPEGSVNISVGDWELKQMSVAGGDELASQFPGGSNYGIFEKTTTYSQKGHFEILNFSLPSSHHTWTSTQVGAGWYDFVKYDNKIIYQFDPTDIKPGNFYMFGKD